MSQPTDPVIYGRLAHTAYTQLAKQVQGVLPTVPPDVLQAGFRCGVEFVLQKLRDGFVIQDGVN